MKLGIIGAMQVEVEILLENIENVTATEMSGSTFYEGVLCGLTVVVVQCGVGKVSAAICTQILCGKYRVTHLVNTGVAGSLNPELDICDIVVSQDAMYHDMDATVFGYAYGQVPGTKTPAFAADDTLMAYAFGAAEALAPGHTRIGRIASGDQFVCDADVKSRIIAHTQAACTEMEGAAVAHTAARNGVPFVIIRAISDKADGSDVMDYPTFEGIAAQRCAQVTMAMAEQLKESEK